MLSVDRGLVLQSTRTIKYKINAFLYYAFMIKKCDTNCRIGSLIYAHHKPNLKKTANVIEEHVAMALSKAR